MEIRLSGKDCGHVETINVSANGVYFSSTAHIPPLTRLQIVLLLPEILDGKKETTREVACEGVVVRAEPDSEEKSGSKFEIACYFTSITDSDREHLEKYIFSHLPF